MAPQCLGFVSFLESSGVLPAPMREIVMDRAMAAPGGPVALDDLKIIVLMVYWSFGEEPDALVLDELCDDAEIGCRTDRAAALDRRTGPAVAAALHSSSRSGFASSLASASRVARTVSASSSFGTSRPACR